MILLIRVDWRRSRRWIRDVPVAFQTQRLLHADGDQGRRESSGRRLTPDNSIGLVRSGVVSCVTPNIYRRPDLARELLKPGRFRGAFAWRSNRSMVGCRRVLIGWLVVACVVGCSVSAEGSVGCG